MKHLPLLSLGASCLSASVLLGASCLSASLLFAVPRAQEINLDAFPKVLRPYLENAEGLEKLEYSLTLQVALSLGQAAEGKKVGKEMRAGAEGARDNWNEILMEALGAAAGKPEGTLLGGGFFYDTGAKYDPEAKSFEILRSPEFLLAPMDGDVAEVLELRRLVYGMKTGLEKEDAKDLRERIEKVTAAQGDDEFNPWVMHATSHLMFMSIGGFDDYVAGMRESGTPFGTWEEFQARVIQEVAALLVQPLRPTLDDEATDGRNFRYEGEYLIQVIGDDEEAPEAAILASEADHAPALLIQIPATEKISSKSKLGRVVIGMVVAGEFRSIYDGKLPFK